MIHSPIKVLVVEDNAGDYLLVKEYLEESLNQAEILHAGSLSTAAATLSERKVDVVLLDLTLPDAMGLDTFHEIYSKATQTPIIVLTGFGDTDLALEALKLGAQDYLVKDDVNPIVLAKSITYGIERSKIRAHLKQSEEQYKYLFYSNPLPMFAVKNDDTRFIMVNQAAIKHYGYSEKEFLKMHLHDIRPKNGIYQGSFEHEKDNDITDIKHRKADGTIIDVELAQHDILLQGQIETLIVVHDVTERNKAKEQLRVSEQMFRTISENFPNGSVAILDKSLKVLYTAGKDFHIPNAGSSFF